MTRRAVVHRSSYSLHKQDLREEFFGQCGYCTLAETELQGIGFQIDHYWSQKRCPQLEEYWNLVWSCQPCNRAKSEYPTTDELRAGRRLFQPLGDDRATHFEVNGASGRLSHLTEDVGEYTLLRLRLTREPVKRVLHQRARLGFAKEVVLAGANALRGIPLQALPREARQYLQQLARVADDEASRLLDSAFLRRATFSPHLDPFPVDSVSEKARRERLEEIHAMGLGLHPRRRSKRSRGSRKVSRALRARLRAKSK